MPPPRKPRRPGGSFHLVYFYPGLPGRFFSACPPSSPAALPSPPNPTQGFALWRGRSGRGKKGSRGRRELGGVGGHSGRGACAGKHRENPGGGGCVSRPPLPGAAAGAALDGRFRVGSARGGPSPGGTGAAPAAASSQLGSLSHGDQSERGWLGGKPREAFIAARVAARSCQDRLPVFQPNGLAHPRQEKPRPVAGPTLQRKEDGVQVSPGGPARPCSPTRASLAQTRGVPPPSTHTLPASSRPERVAWEGAEAGRTDARAPTGRLRAGGEAEGGASGG